MMKDEDRNGSSGCREEPHLRSALPLHERERLPVHKQTTTTKSKVEPDWSFLSQQVLFGRDQEIRYLQEALQSGDQDDNKPRLILVSGKSGSGKSALVKKAFQDLREQKGEGCYHFAMGKFDQLSQLQTAEPYSAFVGALAQLAVSLEENSNQKKAEGIRSVILDKVGLEYCYHLGNLAPHLAKFLRLSSGDHSESHSTTNMLIQQDCLKVALTKFFHALTESVVLVLDDLQWADAQSLDLLEVLVTNRHVCLSIVGICRSNETPWHHTFCEVLRRLEDEQDAIISHLVLPNLGEADIGTLLSRVLQQPTDLCQPLAQVLHKQSDGGNVFFVLQLLRTLLEDGVLTVQSLPSFGLNEEDHHQWLWNDNKWEGLDKDSSSGDPVDQVIRLVSNHIQRLPESCQRLLQTMSCIGAEVGLAFLRMLYDDDDSAALKKNLRIAMDERLIVEQLPHKAGTYAFVHDRVQQASYSLIPDHDKPRSHLAIGKRLLMQLTPKEMESHLFLVVNQLVHGMPLLENEEDKVGLARLCVRAGRKCTKRADTFTAQTYFGIAASLLPARRWRDEYHLSLDLFCSKAEAESCAGDFGDMDQTLEEVLANARSPNDQMRANLIRLYSLGNQNKLGEAMDLGLGLMARLGKAFPSQPKIVYLVPELLKVKWRLRRKTDQDIYNLPMIDIYDKKLANVLSILNCMSVYTFCASPDYFPFVALRGVMLTLKHGLSPMACTSFAAYAVVLCAIKDFNEGYRYAKLALKLLERFPHSKSQILPLLYSLSYGVAMIWKIPILPTIEHMEQAVDVALDSGDFEAAMYTTYTMMTNGFLAGESLAVYDQRINKALDIMLSDKGSWYALTKLERQLVDNLMGKTDNPTKLDMELEATQASKQDFQLYQCSGLTVRVQLGYHFGDIEMALENAVASRKITDIVEACPFVAHYYVLDGLTTLEAAQSSRGIQKQKLLSWVRALLRKLQSLAKACPENILHKVYLLRGEMYAARGNLSKAVEWFTLASRNAALVDVPQFRGLAHERAATAYQRLGKTPKDAARAKEHLNEACRVYTLWGAYGVVTHLQKKHSLLLDPEH